LKLSKLLVSGCALSTLAMILLVSSLVLAAGPRVILIGASWSDPLVARMRDELGVLGFEVEIVVDSAATADLAALARSHGAAAAARVDAASAIDLWVDPALAPGTIAEVRIDGPGDPALLALRAVEVLRGRLIPPGAAPTPDAEPPADAEAPRVAPAPRPDATALPLATAAKAAPEVAPSPRAAGPFALFLAPAVLLSPGGLPAAPHVRLGAEWFPVDRVGVDFVTFLPLVPATVSAVEGSVALRVLELGGGVHGTLTDPAAALSLRVGLGLSALLLTFDGEAAPPFVADRGSRWIASPYASIGALYRAYPRLALRTEMLVTVARPEPVLRIAGHEVASFGQPAVFLSLGIEVRP
jgi:hypothetical protein